MAAEKKAQYAKKVESLLAEYSTAFLVHADHVGSKQFQDIRTALRPDSVILMGKNTLMKRCINNYMDKTGNRLWECLLDLLVGNVGVVFTKAELTAVRDEIEKFKVGAPAKAGVVAPVAVTVKAGSTGLDPAQTQFFQVLNIATKINKGTVEIIQDVQVVNKGDRVTQSQAALLAKLNIKPFTYGLIITQVIESGSVFDPKVLQLTDADIIAAFGAGVAQVASVCLAVGYPTLASLPHSIINGYKNVLSVSVATDYTFPLAAKVKDILSDPTKLAALAAAASAPAAAPAAGGKAAAAVAAAPEPEPEEEAGMAFDLFD
eukprot:jgi/Mesvir1/25412/Mv01445-RA.1